MSESNMEGIEYFIDDMITLPGFVNRHLALMRDLDQKAYEAQLKADDLEDEYFKLEGQQHNNNDSTADNKNTAGNIPELANQQDFMNQKVILTPVPRGKSHPDGKNEAKKTNSKRGGKANAKQSATKQATSNSKTLDDLVQNIQKYRETSVLALKEKISVNDQLMCMLSHENERMKHQFDLLYRKMEKNGKLPPELKFKVENSGDVKDLPELFNIHSISSEGDGLMDTTSSQPSIKSDSKSANYIPVKEEKANSDYNDLYVDGSYDNWDGTCPVCKKGEDDQDEFGMVGCDACNNWFHFHCVNYSNSCRDEPWFCPKCESH